LQLKSLSKAALQKPVNAAGIEFGALDPILWIRHIVSALRDSEVVSESHFTVAT
jgi:hypothetical protein